MTTTRRIFRQADAAEYLGMSVRTLRKLTRAGVIPTFNLGKSMVYDKQDIDAAIEEMKRGEGK